MIRPKKVMATARNNGRDGPREVGKAANRALSQWPNVKLSKYPEWTRM